MKFLIILIIVCYAFCCNTINKSPLYLPDNPFEKPVFVDLMYNPILILSFNVENNTKCILYDNVETVTWFNQTFTYCNSNYGNNWHNYCNITKTNFKIKPLLLCYHLDKIEKLWIVLINNTGSFNFNPECEKNDI